MQNYSIAVETHIPELNVANISDKAICETVPAGLMFHVHQSHAVVSSSVNAVVLIKVTDYL